MHDNNYLGWAFNNVSNLMGSIKQIIADSLFLETNTSVTPYSQPNKRERKYEHIAHTLLGKGDFGVAAAYYMVAAKESIMQANNNKNYAPVRALPYLIASANCSFKFLAALYEDKDQNITRTFANGDAVTLERTFAVHLALQTILLNNTVVQKDRSRKFSCLHSVIRSCNLMFDAHKGESISEDIIQNIEHCMQQINCLDKFSNDYKILAHNYTLMLNKLDDFRKNSNNTKPNLKLTV